jgi:subtilisin family serine protease
MNSGRGGKGCLVFFAAGNGAEEVRFDGYGSYEGVMAVGAVGKGRELSIYSDRGYPIFCCFPSSQFELKDGQLNLIYGLTAADRIGALGYDDSDYFSFFGGTSACASGMAGVAALMLAINLNFSLAEAKDLISKSCRMPDGKITKVRDKNYGYGIINAELLLRNTTSQLKKERKK